MPTENLPPATDKQSAANRPTAPYGYSAAPHGPPPRYNKQAAIGAYGNAVYPKYIYGFHYREFQNIGLPHGDIGTLGNGMTRNPW